MPTTPRDPIETASEVIARYGLAGSISVMLWDYPRLIVDSLPPATRPDEVRIVACLREALKALEGGE